MIMKTVTEVRIDSALVQIKSKTDKDAPSGWSVIAFTPSCSIRCTRVHDYTWFACFVRAIIEAARPYSFDSADSHHYFKRVCEAVQSIIDIEPE